MSESKQLIVGHILKSIRSNMTSSQYIFSYSERLLVFRMAKKYLKYFKKDKFKIEIDLFNERSIRFKINDIPPPFENPKEWKFMIYYDDPHFEDIKSLVNELYKQTNDEGLAELYQQIKKLTIL